MDLLIDLCYVYFLFCCCAAAPAKLPPDDPVETADTTFFEGDIMGMEPPDMTPGLKSVGKNAIIDETLKWPNGIVPYVFSQSYEESSAKAYKQFVLDAMKLFNRTCVRFVPLTTEKHYIIIASSKTCSSYVGRQNIEGGQRVMISIGPCTERSGIVQHELMHALGFFHEQSRIDRDDYVEINMANIREGDDQAQFQKYLNTTAFGEPYDFGSVLHYGMFDFAMNPAVWTIRPLPKYSDKLIGQRDALSDIDIRKINLLYKCAGTNSATTTTDVSTISTTTPASTIAADLTSTDLPVTVDKVVVITTMAPADTGLETPYRGCFFPPWSPEGGYPDSFKLENFDQSLCTYIVVPFESSTGKKLIPRTTDAITQTFVKLQQMKSNNPKLKFLLGIGRKSSEVLGKTASDHVTRSQFLAPILRNLRNWNLDGVDIDFDERYTDVYNVSSIATLVKHLRTAFDSEAFDVAKPRLLLSFTLHYTPVWEDVKALKLEQSVDLVHVAAYNLGKTVTETKTVSHHSPTKGGPFGGATQQNMAIKNEDATNHFDEEIAASYAYTPFWWIGYNDIATVRTKTKWLFKMDTAEFMRQMFRRTMQERLSRWSFSFAFCHEKISRPLTLCAWVILRSNRVSGPGIITLSFKL
ncbi:putative Embryonic protein UVS.2 [Hypsibius exemplaris]|uniref:Metalloendopeptidase n=1 Tax=Hypsibius exemplaris TaxID=2072580 RepID=A0A9X6NL68_HYPEX|nr:putative Embryonic protein UVS.2 [Hypsibius exemplaris]